MTPEDYVRYDATGLAALVHEGEVTPRELCSVAIRLIEQRNPELNAVIESCFERALTEADNAPTGPFRGVPWLIKDLNTMVAGLQSTNGSRAFAGLVAARDAELVARHRRAGLVVLGKTNTPEFGMNICTNPSRFGPTRHPADPARSAGGSSGGSAAAVAAGLVPAAHSTDSAGSIRIPAANCGLFGLKPSRNRVPLGNDEPVGLAGLSTAHAVTHSVRDSALLLDVTHGPLPVDATGPVPPAAPFVGATDPSVGDRMQLRVGLLTEGPAGEVIHRDCVAAAERGASALEELGHHVEPVASPVDGPAFRAALDVVFCAHLATIATVLPEATSLHDLEPAIAAAVRRGRQLGAVDYLRAEAELRRAAAAMARFFTDHDLHLSPTLAHPARPIGHHDATTDDWTTFLTHMLDDIPFTTLFNVTGGPAASVPFGDDGDGLPVGIQLGARPGDEERLLAVCAALEQTHSWHDRI